MMVLDNVFFYVIAASAVLLLTLAALRDVALRTIPNGACMGLALIGAMLRARDGSLSYGLLLACLVFAAAVLCWRKGWMGGGDVKLLGAVALLVPPHQVGDLLLLIAQFGGVLAAAYLVLSKLIRVSRVGQPLGDIGRIIRAERWRIRRGAPLPYGLAIALRWHRSSRDRTIT